MASVFTQVFVLLCTPVFSKRRFRSLHLGLWFQKSPFSVVFSPYLCKRTAKTKTNPSVFAWKCSRVNATLIYNSLSKRTKNWQRGYQITMTLPRLRRYPVNTVWSFTFQHTRKELLYTDGLTCISWQNSPSPPEYVVMALSAITIECEQFILFIYISTRSSSQHYNCFGWGAYIMNSMVYHSYTTDQKF